MTKLLGSILTGLLALQTGLPSLGLHQPVSNIAALVVGVAVASLAFYLKPAAASPTPPAA